MSKYPRRIHRAAAERLLRGQPADPRRPDDLLAAMLATAAAPARADELAGEEAAVAAFRQARAADAVRTIDLIDDSPAAPERSWEPVWARRWTRHPVRIALVALTATAVGGVALAAGSVGWSQGPADPQPASASAAVPRAAGGPSAGRGQGGSPAALPHPSPVGLCHAYTAGAGDAPGKALDNPAFASLIKAAGGKEKVAGYCAAVLAAESKRSKRSNQSDRGKRLGKDEEKDTAKKNSDAGSAPSNEPHGDASSQHPKAAAAGS